MNTEQVMLQQIIKNPEDDALRYAFADWCEEFGQEPRAEFIRKQFELEKEPRQPIFQSIYTESSVGMGADQLIVGYKDTPRTVELRADCQRLFDAHGKEWFWDLVQDHWVALTVNIDWTDILLVFGNRGGVVRYALALRKGFPEALFCRSDGLLEPGYARWLADSAPLRHVGLVDVNPANVRGKPRGKKRKYAWFHPDQFGNQKHPVPPQHCRNAVLPRAILPADGRLRWNFNTNFEACAWLSDRCLEYARTSPPRGPS